MPRFDFKCEQCGSVKTDVILKVTHVAADQPECCGQTMTKAYSTFNAHFKGSGFHATDYHAPTRGF